MRYVIQDVMRRIVLDTDVVVTALRSASGGSNAVLMAVAGGQLVPLVTPALFLEYEAVLKRPEQRLVHGFDLDAIDRFLAALAAASEAVEISFQWRPQLRDANDEMEGAATKFGLRILRPGELLKEIRS
jgi:putative PIN family toxin of toxin-antitoxin system